MTSLAKQLQRLAVPHTQSVLGEDKRRASLLFDHKEAAAIDRETFHALGLNGMDELESIDTEFYEFHSTLFDDSSLTFERSVQTKEVNARLDSTVNRFLVRLSPYCMLKPAHKALEWLIHRFHIHFYNVDDLIKCFLPYHETNIFVRVLQLIKLDSRLGTKWDWLQLIQKNGVHLPRVTLINHCRTNPAFLSYVCDMVPNAVKVLIDSTGSIPSSKCRVLFSFYATTLIGVLDLGPISEDLLGSLLPNLSRGMKSSVTEYKAASYMVLAQLLHKTKLKSELLTTLQKIIAKSLCPELMGEAMACMLLMFQTQDIKLSKKSCRYMCHHYSVVDTISQLSEQFDTHNFLSALLHRLIPVTFSYAVGIATSGESSASESEGSLDGYLSVLHRLLMAVALPDDVAEQAAMSFLKVFISHSSKFVDDDIDAQVKESLQGIVRQLEGKNSAAVDKAVKTMLATTSPTDQEHIHEFLNLYVLSVPHQLVIDSDTSLVLSLNHRLAPVRQRAVKMLLDHRNQIDDGELCIKDAITARIKDDSPDVVNAALQIGQEIWKLVDNDMETLELLQKPLDKGLTAPKWHTPALSAAKILGGYSGPQDLDVVATLLPCLFVAKPDYFHVEVIHVICSSNLATRNGWLKCIAQEWNGRKPTPGSMTIGQINAAMATCVAGSIMGDKENANEIVSKWCKLAQTSSDMRLPCLLMVALDNMVTMATTEPGNLQLEGQLNSMMESLVRLLNVLLGRKDLYMKFSGSDIAGDWTSVMDKYNAQLGKGRVPLVFCLKALHTVVLAVKPPHSLLTEHGFWQLNRDNGNSDVFIRLSVHLYYMILDRVSGETEMTTVFYRRFLKDLEKNCFGDSGVYLKFLCLLWTQHAAAFASDLEMTPILQARSLKLGLAYITSLSAGTVEAMLEKPQVLVGVLIVLTSPHAAIRDMGLQVADHLLSRCDKQHSFTPLLKKIVRCREEHHSDASYIQQVMSSVYASTTLIHAVPRSSPRKTGSKSPSRKVAMDTEASLKMLLDVVVMETTPEYIQYSLLTIFSSLNNQDVLTCLLPLMKRLLAADQNFLSKMAAQCLICITQKFTIDTIAVLVPGSTGLELFVKAMSQPGRCELGTDTPQSVAIGQVTKSMFTALGSSSQHTILTCLFDVCVDTEDLAVANLIRKVLKHLSIDATHIAVELKACLKVSTAKTVRESKRIRREKEVLPGNETGSEFDSRDWQRVVVVLEAVHTKKKLQNYTVLVPVAFQILASILESEHHTAAEYVKQLLLTLLYHVCMRMEADEEQSNVVPERQFQMDLIVNCIRSSENPQTHHQALLVLTSAAKIYPEHLLHNMMSVFTFMGANILRQDDAYSFHIISRILETVIPALITACNQRKRVPKGITNNLEDVITMVIQVFVDAYPHIPVHRRHLLFDKLLRVIGEGQYLWRTLLLMMEHVVTKGTLRAELATESQEATGDVEFCLNICSEFPPSVQLLSAVEVITYLHKLPDDKDDDAAPKRSKPLPQSFGKLRKDDAQIYNVDSHSAKQLRHFKYAAVHLLVCLFSSNDFIAQLAQSEEGDILASFSSMIKTVLLFISHVTTVTNHSGEKPTIKFWRALQHKVHDLLDKLVSLLPGSMFLEVIGGLVSHDLPSIQRKAMDLLNTKLQQQKQFGEDEVSQLLPLVDQLQALIRKSPQGGDVTDEGVMNSQAAFISLRLLCRHIGEANTKEFIKVLKTSVSVFTNRHSNVQVSSCALLCIAEICGVLKVHIIQHLPSFMPALLQVLADREKLVQNDVYLSSVVTTVNKVVEHLSPFLSPYLQDILTHVCLLSCLTDVDMLQKPQVQQRLKAIRTTLSTCLAPRVLLPMVTACHTFLVGDDLAGVATLMALFGDHIRHTAREDLTAHLSQLQAFFITCLDLRVDYPDVDEKTVSELEGVTIDTIITMVMKLSEAGFKPFLFKLYEWATIDEEQKARILVFYRLGECLAEKLRCLFTLFAAQFINHAAKILDLNNICKHKKKYFPTDRKQRRKSSQLLVYIFGCLYKCFLYDTEGFVTKERFDTLLQPLVDQLENTQGKDEAYRGRVTDSLTPCIVQLAVAAQDDSLWKLLNYQVCLKTRSSDPKVREASLQTLAALHQKLGEDYMPLLPDTVPFLAELMEDESEEVEKRCHEVIRDMETTLGEPLQKYF